jgi:hypothetical protein
MWSTVGGGEVLFGFETNGELGTEVAPLILVHRVTMPSPPSTHLRWTTVRELSRLIEGRLPPRKRRPSNLCAVVNR